MGHIEWQMDDPLVNLKKDKVMDQHEKLLFLRLEEVQSMFFPPTIFNDRMEGDLNLSKEFINAVVGAYSLVDELLAHLAGVQATYGDAVIWWRSNGPHVVTSDYHELMHSEFGRLAIYLIESAMKIEYK